MDEARRLRTRLFQELGAYGLLVASVGCGGVVVIEKGGSTGAGGAEPTTASSTSSSTVGVSTGAGPMCSSGGTATEECQLAQSDGSCLDPSQVQDGCCNAADGVTKKGDMCCYWFCPGPCCGRPYVVDGSARRARPIGRSDWAITTPPGAGGALSADSRRERYELEPASRDALTRAWLADALAEHASIASFARFTLDLLALGAPASMVRDAQRAMLDEIEHARLCFGLASRFGATAWGPGALDVEGSRAGVTLADSAARAVVEGCIGETVAALLAREQLACATDADARIVLARIADDEERHALLAWRFVAWARSMGGPDVRSAIERAFDEGTRGSREPRVDADPPVELDLRRFGRLGVRETERVEQAALREVIAELRRALVPSGAATDLDEARDSLDRAVDEALL